MTELNSQAAVIDQQQRNLLHRIGEGSRKDFATLYHQTRMPLVRFLYRYTRSLNLIEEIVDDTMFVVWQKAPEFRGESRVMTWIMGIANRLARKTVEKEKKHHTNSSEDYEFKRLSGVDELSKMNLRDTLNWGLQQLNTEQRVAVELAYFHGFSCEEIASVLECPVSTAKTRLHYSRKLLRKLLTEGNQPHDFEQLMEGLS